MTRQLVLLLLAALVLGCSAQSSLPNVLSRQLPPLGKFRDTIAYSLKGNQLAVMPFIFIGSSTQNDVKLYSFSPETTTWAFNGSITMPPSSVFSSLGVALGGEHLTLAGMDLRSRVYNVYVYRLNPTSIADSPVIANISVPRTSTLLQFAADGTTFMVGVNDTLQVFTPSKTANGSETWGLKTTLSVGTSRFYPSLSGDYLLVTTDVLTIRERNTGGPGNWGVAQVVTVPLKFISFASPRLSGDVIAVPEPTDVRGICRVTIFELHRNRTIGFRPVKVVTFEKNDCTFAFFGQYGDLLVFSLDHALGVFQRNGSETQPLFERLPDILLDPKAGVEGLEGLVFMSDDLIVAAGITTPNSIASFQYCVNSSNNCPADRFPCSSTTCGKDAYCVNVPMGVTSKAACRCVNGADMSPDGKCTSNDPTKPPSPSDNSSGGSTIAIVAGSVVGGLVLFGAIAYCYSKRSRNNDGPLLGMEQHA